MTTPYANIRLDVTESIATLTIDRPEVKNALNRETVDECLTRCRRWRRATTLASSSSPVPASRRSCRARISATSARARGNDGLAGDRLVALRRGRAVSAADDRRDQRLRARRRLRAGARVRHSHRLRDREVRPARARPRHHSGRRRHAAPAARRRTRLGEAPDPDRRDHRRQAGARHRPRDAASRPPASCSCARASWRRRSSARAPWPRAWPSSPSTPRPASISTRACSSRRWRRRSATTRTTSRKGRPRSWRSASRSSRDSSGRLGLSTETVD